MPRTARDIMNPELLAVRPDDSARDTLDLLVTFGVGAAPVLDGARRPVGVVSLRDLRNVAGLTREHMTVPAMCVSISTPIEEAARQLARSDMHHLVVVDSAGIAVGMVSTLDVLRALVGVPTRHPASFPHWDQTTGISWTDDWPLETESATRAPDGAGILALTTGYLGESDAVVWAEACGSVRERVRELSAPSTHVDVALARVLCLRDLRFRAAHLEDEGGRTRIVALLRDRIEHVPPMGMT